jgi:hypothetical protein
MSTTPYRYPGVPSRYAYAPWDEPYEEYAERMGLHGRRPAKPPEPRDYLSEPIDHLNEPIDYFALPLDTSRRPECRNESKPRSSSSSRSRARA